MNHYDIIIIGTGAGGGTLAYKLAPSGKKILLLERGDFLPREKENWDTKAVFIEGRYKSKESWRDKEGNIFHPGIHYYVGGNTKVYGAALLRMRERDFGALQHYDGISPAWPISYTDLATYYTEAEHLYHVHGARGIDPTEPSPQEPFAYPPLPHEPRIQELHDDLQALGLHPFPLPIGVQMNNGNGNPSTVLDRFDGFPDPTESKSDAHVIAVKPALKHHNVVLKTNCYVERLETDASGKEVKKVHVQNGESKMVYSANIVIVACGAVNSAALLLRSKSSQHPVGLANSSDVVGRFYMAHNNSAMLAISKKPNSTLFGKTLGLNDFYFGSDDFPYPMGHIQMLGKSDKYMFEEDAPGFAPGIALDYLARHSMDFWMTSEDLPRKENRVFLDENGTIHLHYTENNLKPHRQLQKKLRYLLEHVGCEHHLIPNNLYLGKKIPLAGTAHQCGTVRFGDDPTTSALNPFCRTHDVQNLYVVDGSFFPSSSAVNPALTIMAMALRTGDYLMQEVI